MGLENNFSMYGSEPGIIFFKHRQSPVIFVSATQVGLGLNFFKARTLGCKKVPCFADVLAIGFDIASVLVIFHSFNPLRC